MSVGWCVCVCVCVRIIFRLEFHTNANILQTILNFHNGKNFEIIWIWQFVCRKHKRLDHFATHRPAGKVFENKLQRALKRCASENLLSNVYFNTVSITTTGQTRLVLALRRWWPSEDGR